MSKTCAVCNCTNKTHIDYSFLGIPGKKESVREKWGKILNCKLKITSFVCEKHFNKDAFYDTHYHAETADGIVLLNVSICMNELYFRY